MGAVQLCRESLESAKRSTTSPIPKAANTGSYIPSQAVRLAEMSTMVPTSGFQSLPLTRVSNYAYLQGSFYTHSASISSVEAKVRALVVQNRVLQLQEAHLLQSLSRVSAQLRMILNNSGFSLCMVT